MTEPQRRACRILAERDWESTRRDAEPQWRALTGTQQEVLVAECERFIGRYLAIAARESA